MADKLNEFVESLHKAHGDNLTSIVLYGPALHDDRLDEDEPKNILIILGRIMPDDLKAAHDVAEDWRLQGNPPPVYFTCKEIVDSSDVFPIEFIDMSGHRLLLYGDDPFVGLDIPTHNLRHQLEYELRGKLIRLRTLYIPASHNPNRLARLMVDSLDSFVILFRHVITIMGGKPLFEKRECIMELASRLNLDKRVFTRIFDYEADEEIWLESETNETFAAYLLQIERVIDAVNQT
ncbi:MAG TPA: hypothetical protein VF131_14735 [Blastocatellia bacterium]|nr:hypothetical protein [Blastocatellia bacterium]